MLTDESQKIQGVTFLDQTNGDIQAEISAWGRSVDIAMVGRMGWTSLSE